MAELVSAYCLLVNPANYTSNPASFDLNSELVSRFGAETNLQLN